MTSWVEVSAERLVRNFQVTAGVVTAEAGAGAELLAVVKADAYGHGAQLCAPLLAGAGAKWLGVTDAAEGQRVREALRAANIERQQQPRVMVMCGMLAEDAELVVSEDLTPVVWLRDQMQALANAGRKNNVFSVHIEIETGMGRQGVRVEDLRDLLHYVRGERRLRVEGILTHFASAERAGSAQTAAQRQRFEVALRVVSDAGLCPEWVHAGNTSAIDNAADGHTLGWLGRVAQHWGDGDGPLRAGAVRVLLAAGGSGRKRRPGSIATNRETAACDDLEDANRGTGRHCSGRISRLWRRICRGAAHAACLAAGGLCGWASPGTLRCSGAWRLGGIKGATSDDRRPCVHEPHDGGCDRHRLSGSGRRSGAAG